MTTKKAEPQVGDLIRYKHASAYDNSETERTGTIMAILSMQYLVVDSRGHEDFAFKRDVIR